MDSWTPGYDDNGSSSLASDDRDEPSITGGNNTSNVDEIYRLDKKTFKSMVELHREGNKTHEAPQNNEMQNSTCESENDTRSSSVTDPVVPHPKPRKLPADPKTHGYAAVQNVARESTNDNTSSPVCSEKKSAEDTGISQPKPVPNTNIFADTVRKKGGIVPASDGTDEASTSHNEILRYGKRSNTTKIKQQAGKSAKLDSSDSQITKKTAKYPIIQTLGDALKFFDLYSRLQLLEISLEDVRRHRKTKEAHEAEIKGFDKELLKLSFEYHPDKVKNRGGSDEDIARAQNIQTALNATRTVLSVLNEIFLQDINTDYRFQYYTRFDIGSMGNAGEIKYHAYEILFKITFILEINQQEITAEIQQFLIEGKKCVQYFLDKNFPEFQKSHYQALFHLKCCVKGYKKFIAELNEVEQECRDDDLENMSEFLRKMGSESSRNLYLLRAIKKHAKKYLHGPYQFFSTPEPLDKYYVLPFASYCNVLAMCSTLMKNRSHLTYLWNLIGSHSEPVHNDDTLPLFPLHCFASFYSGNNNYREVLEPILYDKPLIDEAIREEFTALLRDTNGYLEEKFKISDYHVDNSQRNFIVEQYKKCRELLADFKAKAAEIKDDIEKNENQN